MSGAAAGITKERQLVEEVRARLHDEIRGGPKVGRGWTFTLADRLEARLDAAEHQQHELDIAREQHANTLNRLLSERQELDTLREVAAIVEDSTSRHIDYEHEGDWLLCPLASCRTGRAALARLSSIAGGVSAEGRQLKHSNPYCDGSDLLHGDWCRSQKTESERENP